MVLSTGHIGQISENVQPATSAKEKIIFAKRCRQSSIYCIESEEEEISVVRIQAMKEKAVFATMLVNDAHVNFEVHCGASANIFPCKYVGNEKISQCDRT